MKRIFTAALACLLLAGCAPSGEPEQDALTILAGTHAGVASFCRAIRERFPDIPLDIEYYTGPNTSGYIQAKIRGGDLPDLVCLTNRLTSAEQQEHLLDLSPYPFVNNYNVSILNRQSVDGRIYTLPASYTIAPIYYNKTLFAERGWAVPHSHQELLALVGRIRAESGIIPISFSGLFTGSYFRMMTSYAQCGFLSSPEGGAWESAFAAGEAGSEQGFREGIQILRELSEANAFDPSSGDQKDGQVFDQLLNRECAMAIPLSGHDYLVSILPEYGDEIGAMPYYGLENGESMLIANLGIHFALSKSLGEEGEKLEQALRIMEYLSTEEGQSAMMAGPAEISPLASVRMAGVYPPYQDIWGYVQAGKFVDYMYGGYEDVIIQGGEAIKAALFDGEPIERAFMAMDEAREAALEGNGSLARCEADLTHEQTVQLMADVLLEEGGGDVALVSRGGRRDGISNPAGVSGRLFAGPIFLEESNIVIPGGLNVQLVNVTMTGAELMDLLEQGRVVPPAEEDEAEGMAAFEYYCAGMTVTDGRGAVLADGSPVDPEGSYRVSMAENDFDSTRFAPAEPCGVYIADAYLDYLGKHPVISPPEICRKE